MRCKSCDTLLNEREVKKKEKSTGEFLDLCSYCYDVSQEAVREATEDAYHAELEVRGLT
jgi:hypothetical protein